MKRILCVALCLTLVFLLGACKKENEKELTLDDQIKQAYLNQTGEEAPLEEMAVRYIYTFDDAYAVFVDCTLWVAPTMLTDILVGDYLFSFSSTQEMLIHKNDTCYSLTQAYDQKLLTNEQWKLLHDTWKEQNPHLYSSDNLPPTTVEPTTVPPTSELPINNISQDELDKLYALFGDIQSWYSRALLCEYDSPESLCLFDLFHTGFEGENKLTAAEQDALTKLNAFNENYDYRRLPVDKINLVLTEYFGITLDQIEDAGFVGMVYLEDMNCYYLMANDAKLLESFEVESAQKMDNGNICLRYQANGNTPVFEAILMPVENGYQILSNKQVQ